MQQSLAKSPAIEKKIYYSWLVQYLALQARTRLNAAPMTATTAGDLLKTTNYSSPASLFSLAAAINTVPGIAPIPLGHYIGEDKKKTYCFLRPSGGLLPADIEREAGRGDPIVAQAKLSSKVSGYPSFFLQLGQLCTAAEATAIQTSAPTSFVIVVATDRKVYALFNPLGPNPYPDYETSSDDPIYSEELIKERPRSDKLPGYSAACSAVLLATNINDLVGNNQAEKALAISASSFTKLADGITVKFGFVDKDGWKVLEGVSQEFAQLPKYTTGSAPATAV